LIPGRYKSLFFSNTSDWLWGLWNLPFSRYRGALSLGVEWFGYETDPSPPSGAEVKISRGRATFSHMPSWCGQEQLNLYLVQ